jgi:hypothetical protein
MSVKTLLAAPNYSDMIAVTVALLTLTPYSLFCKKPNKTLLKTLTIDHYL